MTNRIKLRGNKSTALDLTTDTLDTVAELTGGEGVEESAFGTDTIGTTVNDGSLLFTVDGVTVKVPYWFDV